ncbi:MAG: RecB family exonuclease [Terriglobia bacterium]
MPIYSHSQLSMFEQCPQKYKFHYIDRVRRPEEKGVEAFTGSLVHETLERLYDDLKYEKLNSVEDLLGYYHDSWQRGWNSGIKMVREGLTEENYRDYGARCISNYYRRYRPFNQSRTLSTEMHLVFPLDSEGQYKFQGYVDRLGRRADGTYEIHDYKTGGHLPDQAMADRDRQLALYQSGVEARWRDVEGVDLIWHYVGLDATLVSRRTPEQIQDLRQRTIQLIERIGATSDFPPVKSRLCDWCEYRPECPLWNHVVEIESMPPAQMAKDAGVKLVNEFAEVKSQSERLERRLQDLRERILRFAHERRTRVVQGNGLRVSISEREQMTLPAHDEAERIEAERFVRSIGKWDEVSDLSGRRVTEVLKAGAWPKPWRDRLRGFLRPRRIATLRLKRTEDRDTEEDL